MDSCLELINYELNFGGKRRNSVSADVAELADALDSGSSGR